MTYKLDYKKSTYKLDFDLETTSLIEAKAKAIKFYFDENCRIDVFIHCNPEFDDFILRRK